MSSGKEIRDLNKIYMEAVYGGGKKKEAPKDDRMVVTRADKVANTPAYQKYKAGDKAYKAADHLKDDKDWGYDKDGNSLNPVDIEKRKKEDDDLAGAPNKKGKKKAKRWWDDDGDGKGYEKGEVDGKFKKEDYETKKRGEVLSALDRDKRPLSKKQKEKIASDIVKKKGDTSKSDDRYAYEELTHLRALVEKEVKVKDTRRTVDAIRAYDKSKDASRDADWDTEHGEKEKGDIEKKYAKKERGEIDKDDPNWKKRKYHTGIHGEEVEALVASGKFSNEELMNITNLQEADIADILARLEKKRISKGGDPEESPLPAMRKYHADKKKKKVEEELVKPAGTSDAAVDKATRKAATRRFGNTTPPKAKIPG